jgi:hypothetical protein
LREGPLAATAREPGIKRLPPQSHPYKNRGSTIMKSLIVLTAVAVLTIGNAIAAMPGAAGSVRTASASQPVVSMAEQELPFDRYWSKN